MLWHVRTGTIDPDGQVPERERDRSRPQAPVPESVLHEVEADTPWAAVEAVRGELPNTEQVLWVRRP